MDAIGRLALHVKPHAEAKLKSGHPWLFDASIVKQKPETGKAGDIAVIYDRHNRLLALGLYDPTSPIRVKVVHLGGGVRLDDGAWLMERVAQAVARRSPLAQSGITNGYRLIHGENDGLPALILDRYAETLVLKLYSPIWLPYLEALQRAIIAAMPASERLILRLSRDLQKHKPTLHDGQTLFGASLNAPVTFLENGLSFTADVLKGHKTGFFFDQRDNRLLASERANGRDVLDVFAYVGAFSVYCAWGGAKSVTSVDISAPALAQVQAHLALNVAVTANTAHRVLAGDAFALLRDLHRQNARYDMLIIDPPTFASSQQDIPRALSAYRELARLGMPLLKCDGVFVMASCTARVSADDFFRAVNDGVRAGGRSLHEEARTAHALDHPISFPEGAYLKCLFGTVS